MTDTPDATYRQHYQPDADDIAVRDGEELDDGEEGIFAVRMPIASTGEVRNEGDDPLTRAELDGMARQVSEGDVGVFPAHGKSAAIAAGRYNQFERLGDWTDATVEEREGADVLVATARMPDPEDLPAATGDYREALAVLKEQATRGIGINASIGWDDREGFPGGVDLMEASIVGIGADWRTNTDDESAEVLARAAVDAGADPDALLAEVARATAPEDGRPFGPPNAPDKWDSFDQCVADVEDWENVDDPEAFCGWAKAQTESANAATAETDSMTDPDDPGDDQAGTDEEQAAGDDAGERTDTERAPGDVTPEDLADFIASHYEGADVADVLEAWEGLGEYVGAVDLRELATLVGAVVDQSTGDVLEMLEAAMDADEGEQDEDGEQATDEDEDMDDDEEERSDEGDEDDERDADAGDDDDDAVAEIRSELADLREDLQAIRNGDAEAEVPSDREPDDEDGEERDSDADEQDERTSEPAAPNWR